MDISNIKTDFDWRHWISRWDRMQEHYFVGRTERFNKIIRMIQATRPRVSCVVDLGCGTGSVSFVLLEAFPKSQLVGIDFDPTMLLLAKERLKIFGNRARIVSSDLRNDSWKNVIESPVDAVVSATALHWLNEPELDVLYGQISSIMKPGGIFLNADHVGSQYVPIQNEWRAERAEKVKQEGNDGNEDWDAFWVSYSEALQINIQDVHNNIAGGWEGGAEQGMPLVWHFDSLRKNGFKHVDCFWRDNCDAIYGGIK